MDKNSYPKLRPTDDQRFEIIGRGRYDFVRRAAAAADMQAAGDVESACNERFHAFQDIVALLPEEEEVELRWEHDNTAAAIEILHDTAVDHFLLGDLEMATAVLEMLLDVDPEDHTGSVCLLALCYAATQEWEAFDEISIDLNDKLPAAVIARLWAGWRRGGTLDGELLRLLQRNFKEYFAEFTADEHPADEEYLRDISSASPSRAAEARELWLQTEPLWREFSDFIEALQAQKVSRG
ncbi:MAG: hypothetical protein J6K38_04560 [Alistipes sp.]|nr:hypothetical protein [Alistipes sp.]